MPFSTQPTIEIVADVVKWSRVSDALGYTLWETLPGREPRGIRKSSTTKTHPAVTGAMYEVEARGRRSKAVTAPEAEKLVLKTGGRVAVSDTEGE